MLYPAIHTYTPPRLVLRGLKVRLTLAEGSEVTGVMVSVRSCCIQEIVGRVTSGIGGVAVQRREREEPATESPDTLMVTTGGGGTVGGIVYYSES